MRKIDVNDLQHHLPHMVKRVIRALRHVLAAEGVKHCELSVALVDDERIRELNRRYLNHDYATDVISFRLDDEGDDRLSGEVVVSAERACAVAAEGGGDPEVELLLYAVHGCLHVLGYDDQSPAEYRAMHRREDELLAALGHPGAVGNLTDP
jgi:probable rRNA maturation factor